MKDNGKKVVYYWVGKKQWVIYIMINIYKKESNYGA